MTRLAVIFLILLALFSRPAAAEAEARCVISHTTAWPAGPLKGYEIIRHRDPTGRDTGFTLKRDGAVIHTAQQAPDGASDQISTLASGNLIVIPQRDAAGRITGFHWGNATGTWSPSVIQKWERGTGGRIESARTGDPEYRDDTRRQDTRRKTRIHNAGASNLAGADFTQMSFG